MCGCEFTCTETEINWTEDRGRDFPTTNCPECHNNVWLKEVIHVKGGDEVQPEDTKG